MGKISPNILLVNPWVHDFAAYDFWAKPYGLLLLGSIIRDHGLNVSYIDCLDRFHPKSKKTDPFLRGGRGPLLKTRINLPEEISHSERRYSRYGIKPEWLEEDLKNIQKPDIIFITSIMTYWAPGVFETIRYLKKQFPETPVVLGGIYATLCYEHALKNSGADIIVKGAGEKKIFKIIEKFTGKKIDLKYDTDNMDNLPMPAFDLQNFINYIPLMTSRGCPFSCSYCASNYLEPEFKRKSPKKVMEEIKHWHENYGIQNFAFYDDALLVNKKNYALPLFKSIIEYGKELYFHTPNAVHAKEIDAETAVLMFRTGFKTIRIGVETTDFNNRESLDEKITENDFINAVNNLGKAGFAKDQVGAYLLVGLPDQSYDEVEHSVKQIMSQGITPVMAHYTPIPHTAMWEKAVLNSSEDIENNPVLTNNAIFPCTNSISLENIFKLKHMISGKDS